MGNDVSAASSPGTGASPVRRATARPEYTIRVCVRGERMAGKTSLVRMLLNEPFVPEYEPTPAIAASSLDWCFKSTNEQVRCVLWDVVEQTNKTRAKPVSQELKLAVKEAKAGSVTLGEADAQSVDVLRGAHAVFVVYDPHKRWTFEFCLRQLESLPPELDVLVISNFRDAEAGVEVTSEEAKSAVLKFKSARFLECSCRNGFGKTQIMSFLNLPFLRVQREHLKALLARNVDDFQLATEEFDLISFEIDYKAHLKWADAEPMPVFEAKKKAASAPVVSGVLAAVAVDSPKTVPASPVVVSPKTVTPPPRLMAVELAEDENLDDFLQKEKADGWGETIASDDDSSSDNEMVRQPKLTATGAPKSSAPEKKEEEKKKTTLVAEVAEQNDGWGETIVSSDSEEDVKPATAPVVVAVVAAAAAQKKTEIDPAVAAALEAARWVAEEQAAAAAAAASTAAASSAASASGAAKKKKAGTKKKTGATKKKGTSGATATAAAPRRDDYAQH